MYADCTAGRSDDGDRPDSFRNNYRFEPDDWIDYAAGGCLLVCGQRGGEDARDAGGQSRDPVLCAVVDLLVDYHVLAGLRPLLAQALRTRLIQSSAEFG